MHQIGMHINLSLPETSREPEARGMNVYAGLHQTTGVINIALSTGLYQV